MDAIECHREGLKWAYELLESTMNGVNNHHAYWIPPGKANPLKAVYAHALCGMDALTAMLGGTAPLFASTWAGRTGISQPQLQMEFEWGRELQVDLAAARQYGQAAYQATDAFIASLSKKDLQRPVDLSAKGLGNPSVSWCITALITSHVNLMAGEISTLKGLQGLQGYPF